MQESRLARLAEPPAVLVLDTQPHDQLGILRESDLEGYVPIVSWERARGYAVRVMARPEYLAAVMIRYPLTDPPAPRGWDWVAGNGLVEVRVLSGLKVGFWLLYVPEVQP